MKVNKLRISKKINQKFDNIKKKKPKFYIINGSKKLKSFLHQLYRIEISIMRS